MKKLIVSLMTLLMTCCVMAVPQPKKKLIHFGWNEPKKIEDFQNRSLEELSENAPFDGIGLRMPLNLVRDGKKITYFLGRPPKSGLIRLEKDDFKEWIPALRRLQQTRLKHNFFDFSTVLFSPDWFDDNAWSLTMNNITMLAWLAKQSQFVGLAMDIEPYSFSGYPLMFHPELGHSFEETAAQVRRRAKQLFEAVAAEFPNLILHCCFWGSMCINEESGRHPEGQNYGETGLKVAFINGIYDGAPLTMRILDGVETQGYRASGEAAYQRVLADFHRFAAGWIAPENMDKYRRITELSFPLYLDSYIPRETTGSWRLFATTDNPARLLFENMWFSLKYSDEYAWLWAEKGTFWPKINEGKDRLFWNDRLAFVTDALAAATDINSVARHFQGKNLARNSGFEVGKETPATVDDAVPTTFPEWGFWQQENHTLGKGTVSADNGGVRFKAVANSAIAQAHTKFKPGSFYLLTARARLDSPTQTANINYFYRDKNGEGLWALRRNAYFDIDDGDGWKRAMIVFNIPTDIEISSLSICISVNGLGNKTPADDPGTLFDDFELYEINFPWEMAAQSQK